MPDLPLRHFRGHEGSCGPYTVYLEEHLAWKKLLYPNELESKLKRSCLVELEAISLGFPGIDDKGPILGLAADLVYTCEVDDLIETMNIHVAERCVRSCVAILQGDESTAHCE